MISNPIISLPLQYNIPVFDEEDKHIEYGRKLREVVENNIPTESFNIINDESSDMIKCRYIDYLIARMINMGMFYLKSDLDKKEEKIYEELSSKYIFEEPIKKQIFHLIIKICTNYISNTNIPSSGEKRKIKSTAKRNFHKCYICGRTLEYENSHRSDEKNKCEIEHIFPRTYGGSRNKKNLTVCCENCNKIKQESISYCDIYFEGFITSSKKPENVKLVLKKDIKLSLLEKQNLKCATCNNHFFEIDDLEYFFLMKKEDKDIYHYLNSEIICSTCHKEKSNLEGVQIDLQL